jgi:tRNA nucleotidyltransferase (CCA-adding enzyme)
MQLLTTHINADFDALAAVVAAQRLHPEAKIFFPGSREESVRRMLESGFYEVAELKRKDVEPGAITRIILCDVRQRDRIGIVAQWLEEHPGIEVLAYDHHPDEKVPALSLQPGSDPRFRDDAVRISDRGPRSAAEPS